MSVSTRRTCSQAPVDHGCFCTAPGIKTLIPKNTLWTGNPAFDIYTCCGDPNANNETQCDAVQENRHLERQPNKIDTIQTAVTTDDGVRALDVAPPGEKDIPFSSTTADPDPGGISAMDQLTAAATKSSRTAPAPEPSSSSSSSGGTTSNSGAPIEPEEPAFPPELEVVLPSKPLESAPLESAPLASAPLASAPLASAPLAPIPVQVNVGRQFTDGDQAWNFVLTLLTSVLVVLIIIYYFRKYQK